MTMKSVALGAVILAAFGAAPASAVNLAVTNASFETLPAGGLPSGGCGAGCTFSDDDIPGWTNDGTSGQFRPGPASGNFTYFNYVPDGLTVAYSNGGSITQTVGATAVAGTTYTLNVDFGVRHDVVNPGYIQLFVGSHAITATGTYPAAGDWATYTASYTATALDTGGAITIFLYTPTSQGDFDNVVLSATGGVPEPESWALLIAGFGMTGLALRTRRRNAATA